MTVKSINDEIRRIEKLMKNNKELLTISLYECRLQTLKEVRELIEKICLKHDDFNLDGNQFNPDCNFSMKNEILGSSND